ncbi:MAG: zinc-dependent metalloprotease [Acidobacteria bacterium]|nr:zinc-dependent metalloprotease [Acidobacteriota bacterium]
MQKRISLLLVAAFLILGLAPSVAEGKKKEEAEEKPAAEEAAEPKAGDEKEKDDDKPFDEVIEDFEAIEGFFTFYRNEKEGKVYLEIRPEQMDTIFLCSITRSAGDGFFFDSGAMLGEFLFVFTRVGKTIRFLHKNVYFQADKGTAIRRALDRGLSDSLMGSAKIESAPHPERGSVLVDPSSFFIQDISAVGYIFKKFIDDYEYSFDKENSHFGTLKSFPGNSEIDTVLYFKTDAPKSVPTLPDNRSFRHIYHYSLSALPDTDFRPRLADDRVGHFLTMHQDYSSPLQDTPYVRYVNRWDLQKAEPKFEKSKPRQPIVFWLENTIPVQFRDSVREGILLWNDAFERIGFEEAIVVKQQPDDADWDPSDVRYNTVRWIVRPGGGYAVGPSRTNPFTGQIYDADIRVSADMLRFVYREFEEFAAPVAQGDAIAARLGILGRARALCDHQQGAAQQAAFGWSVLSARAMSEAAGTSGINLEEFIHQFLVEVIAHEVGHTLGLRHNFKASTIREVDDLHDPNEPFTGSVMDYNPVNVAPKNASQGNYYQTVLGPYDYWAIEYAYRPISADSPESEKSILESIASKAADPLLQYGTDEDAFGGPRGMDPMATRWDLGSDSVDYYVGRVALAEELWSSLEQTFETPGERYQKLRMVFGQGFREYRGAVRNVSKYIGGLYHRRDHIGDPGGRLPFEPVNAGKQRQALQFLTDEIFSVEAFAFPTSLLDKVATERMWDFSRSLFEQPRNDYPIHQVIRSIQSIPLDHVYSPVLMSRMLDIELREGGDHLTLPEVFDGFRDAIWSEVAAHTDVGSIRRGLQREHLNKLVGLVVNPAPETPQDASALARADLKRLADEIGDALGSGGLDTYTSAHLDESLALMEAALDAGIDRKLGG